MAENLTNNENQMSTEENPWSNMTPTEETTSTESVEEEQSEEVVRDPRVESLAIPIARDYAEKNYPKQEDGTFTPAWRGVNGEKAYKNKSPEQLIAEGMSPEEAYAAVIDIANTPYDKYSEYWKEQNRGSAEYLISLLDELGADEILKQDFAHDEAARQKFGDLVHNDWLSRNEWAKDGELGVPYADLPPAEQQKDIDQLVILQKWIQEQSAGETEA